jgi:hypothetical protein
LNQRLCQSRPETVWFMTPSLRPGHRVHADEERGVAARSRNAVYSVHSSWTTNSQPRSRSSGSSELNVQPSPAPWQSMTTISVAPPPSRPRTAALISSV